MRRKSKSRPAIATRDRILNAAIRRFSRQSYEQTGLRDIAADVGVDVAYVHRSFGSKKLLLVEAMRAARAIDDELTGPAEARAGALAKVVVSRGARTRRLLDILIRSLSSPEATPVVREFILSGFVKPLVSTAEHPETIRIALVGALLMGVSIFRNVVRIGPLLDAESGELEALVAHAITGIMNAGEHDKNVPVQSRTPAGSSNRKGKASFSNIGKASPIEFGREALEE